MSLRQPVRVYSGLTPAAMQKQTAGALALWYMARSLDSRGAGVIDEQDLKECALEIWSRDKFYRAYRRARELGMMVNGTRRRDGQKITVLRSLATVARLMGAWSLGAAPVVIRLSALRTVGTFKAALFAAWHAGRDSNGRPISRETITGIVGISAPTQRRYEKQHNARRDGQITPQRNFLMTGLKTDSLTYARENLHPGCYLYGSYVVRPLPNTYSSTLKRASHRTAHKVNSGLKRDLLNLSGDGQRRPKRLFYDNADIAKQATKRSRREERGKPSAFVDNRLAMYQERSSFRGAGIWRYS
jgi:hypothetical protein